LLYKAVGPEGTIIGVDMTDEMLSQARRRVKREKWRNVELVHGDASAFSFPKGIDGILSTFALTLVPEFDLVILNGCGALKSGKRWVILDFKVPSGWLSHLAPLGVLLIRPFAATEELTNRRPWESLYKYMRNVQVFDLFFGFAYIAVGEQREDEN
jgi:demethylmenaquinone methyltransferase/2-methoxy-6-polyprenyl-1,4-benzoquinol methylase